MYNISLLLFKVAKDGNWMVNAIYEQLSLKSDGITYLRRQVVDHAINNIENLREYLEKNIKELYGRGMGKWVPLAFQVTRLPLKRQKLGRYIFLKFSVFYVGVEAFSG